MEREIYHLCREVIKYEKKYPLKEQDMIDLLNTMERSFFIPMPRRCGKLYTIPEFAIKIVLMNKCTTAICQWNVRHGYGEDKNNKFDKYLYNRFLTIHLTRQK